MSRICLSALAFLLANSATAMAQAPSLPPATAVDQARLTEAKAIIDIMFPPLQREQIMQKMVSDLITPFKSKFMANEISDPGLSALTKEAIDNVIQSERLLMNKHLPLMFDAMATAYTREFSLAELRDVHAFALSPAGGHYLKRSVAIIADPAVQKVNLDMMTESQGITKIVLKDFKTKLVAYLAAHPDVAKKLGDDKAP